MDRPITRRDFIDGMAVGAGALALGSMLPGCGEKDEPAATAAAGPHPTAPGASPEARTGLRGQTDAAFSVPHQLRDGSFWDQAGTPVDTGESYDLVVVGAGISGLAAARYFQRAYGRDARILILDPLDEPGGHASRNEFTMAGSGARTLISYGGSQSIYEPRSYLSPASALIEDIGIEPQRFLRYFDRSFEARHGLRRGVFFDRETYGSDQLVFGDSKADIFRAAPLDAVTRDDLIRLYESPSNPYPGLSDTEIKEKLTELTYLEFLRDVLGVSEGALGYLQNLPDDEWGYGIDAVGAIDAWADDYPGLRGLGLDYSRPYRTNSPTEHRVWDYGDPYIFHFPDGNAGIARSLIRRLIPQAIPGTGMETISTTPLDYARLDDERSKVRIRLGSPVVRVRHLGDPDSAREVEVAYVSGGGELRTVRAGYSVMACFNSMVPYLCEELPTEQRDALSFATRLPLMYTSVAVRNWSALDKLKLSYARSPSMYWLGVAIDFPVSIGDYRYPESPEEPIVLHLSKALTKAGMPPREGGRAGRSELITTSFEEIERATRDQLGRILAGGDFDPAADIEAIAVNRWAHGYAMEYVRPWDEFWPDGPLPSHIARQRFGRIAIANSDSAPRAYADTAMDMAYRAVAELAGRPPGVVSRGVDGAQPA